MRISALHINNFRAVRNLDLIDLPNAVVIAGSNGSGKSSVFDAIRLLKSAYGQYHQNELQQWFSEAQINIQRIAQEAAKVLYDPSAPLIISAEIELADSERSYLKNKGAQLIEELTWQPTHLAPFPPGPGTPPVVKPSDRRARGKEVERVSAERTALLQAELDQDKLVAKVTMTPNGKVDITESQVIELIFSSFDPNFLGIIDYHGPHRNYGRDALGGINLNIEDASQKYSQHALYNTQSKYSNVKSEMARTYIRQLLAKETGVKNPDDGGLIKTLHELFDVFFPGKKFLGVIPTADGGVSFPVELETGQTHDINELSSGEKEVLLGYLHLRDSAPKNSIILLDEPELHLNPRLIRGLPRFYQRHLGAALNNQLWLITHSDALLREAVDEPAYAVYHMEPPHVIPSGNQVHPVAATAEMERAVMALVGDLATYSPRSKVVILEGGGDAEFDLSLIQRLFPQFAERVNLISAGSKKRVAEMHALLEDASSAGRLDAKFFAIVDRDFDGPPPAAAERLFAWDVYHLENYLLEPKFIREVVASLKIQHTARSEADIERLLQDFASETVDSLVRIKMERVVNGALVKSIDTGFDPRMELAKGFREAAERSKSSMERKLEEDLRLESLIELEKKTRESLTNALKDGRWRAEFRGRDILQRFSNLDGRGIGYEQFRNLIASRMAEAGYQPEGMKKVIDGILEAGKG